MSTISAKGDAVLLTVAPEYEKHPFGREERHGAIFPVSKAKKHYPAKSRDRKSTRLNSSHRCISYAVFCLKKKKKHKKFRIAFKVTNFLIVFLQVIHLTISISSMLYI